MKLLTKKWISLTAVCIMLLCSLTVSTQAAAKKTYWLSGISKAADGTMHMYYKGKTTVLLKGKIKKSASQDSLSDAKEKKSAYTLKVADRCKVHLIEADHDEIMAYGEWAARYGYEKGNEISFISVEIKVKNKKIVQISFSA